MVTFTGFPWSWGGSRLTTVEQAQELLGPERVYESDRVMPAWGKKGLDVPVLYPIQEIKRRAKENQRKKDRMDWRLVYGVGMSIWQQFDIRGDDPRVPPAFCESNTLWRQPCEDSWTREPFVSGYYLINFKLLFKNYRFETQDLRVSELGKIYSALPPQILSEALFSIYMLTGKQLLKRELHSAPILDSYKCHVKIGYFDANGLSIGSFDYRRIDNGIVTHLRPHIPSPHYPSKQPPA